MFSRSSPVSEAAVLDALRIVHDPDLHKDIVSLGFVKGLRIDGGRVAFTIELTTPACPVKDQLRDQAVAAVRGVAGVTDVAVEMTASVRSAALPEGGRAPIPGIRNVIAVGAGKGGVGKTTVAVNLAIALARLGGREADLFGRGGGEGLAGELGVPFLGRVPLYEPVRAGGDAGVPIVVGEPESAPARALVAAAEQVAARISIASYSRTIPLTPVR